MTSKNSFEVYGYEFLSYALQTKEKLQILEAKNPRKRTVSMSSSSSDSLPGLLTDSDDGLDMVFLWEENEVKSVKKIISIYYVLLFCIYQKYKFCQNREIFSNFLNFFNFSDK